MSAMDHGTAHERIEDLLLEPARLSALRRSEAPEDAALREHLDGCPACRADLDGWARLQAALTDALPAAPEAAVAVVEPVELPASLRARVISAVRSPDMPVAPVAMAGSGLRRSLAGWPAPRGSAWLGLAAAVVVLVVGAGLLVDQAGKLEAAQAETRSMEQVVAAVDRILAEPKHKVVQLLRPDGTAAGSISWSRHDWVVLTTGLTEPSSGQRYKCWLDDGTRSVPVGVMDFADGTAYWVATLDEWQTWEIGPSTRFVVSLEAADAQVRNGPPVLSAVLGS
jgi:hypothetical protein